MKLPKHIGKVILFGSVVTVYAVKGSEGEGVSGWSDEGTYLRINVGLDGDWKSCLEVVLHEVIEMAMILRHTGYVPLRLLSRKDASMYRYAFNHEEYTEIIQNAADALQYLVPLVHDAWEKHHAQ